MGGMVSKDPLAGRETDIDDERLLGAPCERTFSRLRHVVGGALRVARLLVCHRLMVGIREPSFDANSAKTVSAALRFFPL